MPRDNVRSSASSSAAASAASSAIDADAILAALAARAARPAGEGGVDPPADVRQCRPPRRTSLQRVRLGADRDGRLTGAGHEALVHTAHARRLHRARRVADARILYAAPQPADHAPAGAARPAGGRAPCARRARPSACSPSRRHGRAGRCSSASIPSSCGSATSRPSDPENGTPFSTRQLVDCLQEGAERFGWDRRATPPGDAPRRPLARRLRHGGGDPRQLPAAGARPRRCSRPTAGVTVQTGMTDIGTGTYTVLAQIAAETLGVPLERVTVEIGDSDLPPAPGSGGSFGAGSAGSAVLRRLRERCAASWRQRPALNDPTQLTACGDGRCPVGGRDRCRSRPPWRACAGRAGGRGRDQARQARCELFAERLRRASSPRSASTRTPARCACAACSACSPPAASSTPRPRARSRSAA